MKTIVICSKSKTCSHIHETNCTHYEPHEYLGLICACKCPHFSGSCIIDIKETRKEKLKKIQNMKTCHSGGASGSDYIFENESTKKGFNVIAYSFEEHNTKSKNRLILSNSQLKEGFEHIKIANKRLNRNLNKSDYVKNLIARDWFQVKNSDAIFAIGNMETESTVSSGTGYACACAIDEKKPIYFFEQNDNQWYYFDYESDKFEIYESIPKLTENFAGIGTRKINDNGVKAIINLFKNV